MNEKEDLFGFILWRKVRRNLKGGFSLFIEMKPSGPHSEKFLGFGSSCPFSLPAIELSNWKNTSFCSLLVLPPVLAAELNVLGFLWCEQDLPLGKVGGGWKENRRRPIAALCSCERDTQGLVCCPNRGALCSSFFQSWGSTDACWAGSGSFIPDTLASFWQ